jgi:hypothetical protein
MIQSIQSLLEQVSSLDGRNIHTAVKKYEIQLADIIWKESFSHITNTKVGVKQSLIQALERELIREMGTEIINPQRDVQQAAIIRQSISKVDRLPLNAKLHLLKHNSLLNNLQLAFSDPADYVEFDKNHFISMHQEQIQDEIRRAINHYIVINPLKAKTLYHKLWLPPSLEGTQELKKIFSEAKIHTYTRSLRAWAFKEKTTPRITYIQWYPMLFGKNLVHVPYGYNTTRAEKSKYDIDTSAKIFDDFYSLIRAHSHIQDSEQAWIQSLTELHTLFAQASNIVKDKNKREELESLIQEIIAQLITKKDSKVSKARIQDLEHILQTHHITQNQTKLFAARNKIKERITSQQEIKNTVSLQQNALYQDLWQQAIHARELIHKLQSHLKNFNLKNRSARKLAQSYQEKLYAKPFFDLHDHIIQLEDQAKLYKWIPYTLQQKMTTDLILQRRYINILNIEHNYKTSTNTIDPKTIQQLAVVLTENTNVWEPYQEFLITAQQLTQELVTITDNKSMDQQIEKIKAHMQHTRQSLLN